MAAITKVRTRPRRDGVRQVRWQLDYIDSDGERHRQNFKTKAAADARRVEVEGQLASGTHTPDRSSKTVLEALRAWLKHFEDLVKQGEREQSSLDSYLTHVELHIARDEIAHVKLSRLTTPTCQAFVERLEKNETRPMRTRLLKSLRTGISYAARKGWIVGNPAREAKPTKILKRTVERVVIPSKDELRRILLAAEILDALEITPWAHPAIHTKLFTGLRISELRALHNRAPSLELGVRVTVNERADNKSKLGAPKSAAARRSVPLGPVTTRVLKDWLARQLRELNTRPNPRHLLFPTGAGTIESYANIYNRIWGPTLMFAGVTIWQVSWRTPDDKLKRRRFETQDEARVERDHLLPLTELKENALRDVMMAEVPRYGIHALRHAAASAWIEQGLTPKQVQARLGHEDITLTMNLYGHLWPDEAGDRRSAAATERVILG